MSAAPPAAPNYPFFSPDGQWLAFFAGSKLKKVSITVSSGKVTFVPFSVVGDSFRAGKPQLWSPTPIRSIGDSSSYDLHPDGKRIAAAVTRDQAVVQDKLVFMFNFFDYLRQIAPVKK